MAQGGWGEQLSLNSREYSHRRLAPIVADSGDKGRIVTTKFRVQQPEPMHGTTWTHVLTSRVNDEEQLSGKSAGKLHVFFFTMRELEDGTVQETHTSVIREKIRMMLFTPSMSRHQSRLEKEREKNRRVWVVLMWGFERQDGPSGLGRCKASLFSSFFSIPISYVKF